MKSKRQHVSPTDGDTVVGLFREQPGAERAIRALKTTGFSDEQIGIVMRDRERQQDLSEHMGTKVEEGAATGAMGGGLLGGALGLLAGIGALVIPGIGPIVVGGAIASTLAGAGIGAAAGGLLGALVGMGIPEEEARHFEHGVREGGILVTVRAGPRAAEAREILRAQGADLGSATSPTHRTRAKATEKGGERLETHPAGAPIRGSDRRYRQDPRYAGPERRVAAL